MIRTAKDIPAEIKNIVGKFYMNNVEGTSEAIAKLRVEKPEYYSLLDNVEQLFENAPDSVFMFYDKLIALENAEEEMSPELDFSIDSIMDGDDDGVDGPSPSDSQEYKFNLDDEMSQKSSSGSNRRSTGKRKSSRDSVDVPEGFNLKFDEPNNEPRRKERRDSVELPAGLNFNFDPTPEPASPVEEPETSVQKNTERNYIEPLRQYDADPAKEKEISLGWVKQSESAPVKEEVSENREAVKSCFSEIMERPAVEEKAEEGRKSLDIPDSMRNVFDSSAEMKAVIEQEKSSRGAFVEKQPTPMPTYSPLPMDMSEEELPEEPESAESLGISIEFDDNDLNMPNLFADDEEEENKEEIRQPGRHPDFSFSKVLDVPKSQMPESTETPAPCPTTSLTPFPMDSAKSGLSVDNAAKINSSSFLKKEKKEESSGFFVPVLQSSDNPVVEPEEETPLPYVNNEDKPSTEDSGDIDIPIFGIGNLMDDDSKKADEHATPLPEDVTPDSVPEAPAPVRQSISNYNEIPSASRTTRSEEPLTPVPEFVPRSRVATRNNLIDFTPIPEKIDNVRRFSPFSGGDSASEHKTMPALEPVPSAGLLSPRGGLNSVKSSNSVLDRMSENSMPLPGFQNSKLRPQKITSVALNAIPPATTRPQKSAAGSDPIARLRPLSRIPRLVCKLSEIPQYHINPRAGFLLSLIDGHTSISDILDISAWSEEETATQLLELEEHNIIFFH